MILLLMDTPAKALQCVNCARYYEILPINYCDACFSPVIPIFSPTSRGEDLKRSIQAGPQNLFRYGPLLPTNSKPNYEVGYTDFSQEDGLGEQLGLNPGKFFLKVDYGTVSGTFKDRGVAVVTQLFKEFNERGYNFQVLAGTSTGNLAAAIAANADKNGLIRIKIPRSCQHILCIAV